MERSDNIIDFTTSKPELAGPENPKVTVSSNVFFTVLKDFTIAASPPPNTKLIPCFTKKLLSPSVPVTEAKAI